MQTFPREEEIIAAARKMYPRKGYTRDAFVNGAMWADISHWKDTKDEKPKEGSVVLCIYQFVVGEKESGEKEITSLAMNIATYKDGVFQSYSKEEPMYWCYPPAFSEVVIKGRKEA